MNLSLIIIIMTFITCNSLSADTKKATFKSSLDKSAEIKIIDAQGKTRKIDEALILEKGKKGFFDGKEIYIKDIVVSKANEFKGTKKASEVKGLLEYINGHIEAQNNIVFTIKYQKGSTGLSISAS